MSKKLMKLNKLLIPLAISGTLPFIAAQCDKKSKNEPQTEKQKIDNVNNKIKELLKTLKTNKTKYAEKDYEELNKTADQIVLKIETFLNKQNASLNELTQFETEIKEAINNLENTYEKLKNEGKNSIAKYEESKKNILKFFKLLSEKPVDDNLDLNVDKSAIETIIKDTDNLIKDTNTINKQISEKTTLFEQQITQISQKIHTKYESIKAIVEERMKPLIGGSYTDVKNQIYEIFKNADKNKTLDVFYENTYYLLSVKFKKLIEIKNKELGKLKQELTAMIIEANSLKETVKSKHSNIPTEKLEKAIANATTELNNSDATKESMETAKNNLSKEVSTIKEAIAKVK
ncbi:hypothetical protein NPA07_00055 [Mycoplasmopsis caviae]|uniref:Lipoprotein n=1 Tax=Mycoplasmopsis caviae TaxID=55603 RepID=A0A3P8LI27_9BACT|nr:hypothetical protein [Mycoplasmopsis caviae]UUD35263.1 hypothetical protein NPA07_00055 [Mycoplasmopsis caviae]VDR41952.1 Uncharacterised protein [Mycoplasmopsis caviae]